MKHRVLCIVQSAHSCDDGSPAVRSVSQGHVEHQADVRDVGAGQVFQHGNQIEKFVVVGIAEPAADGHGVLRMEDVARGRVVDDDCFPQIAAHHAQILDVVALVVVAAFAEEPVMYYVVYVELVEQRITVLGYRGREDDDLIQLPDSLHEGVDARSLDDVDIVVLAFDLDRDCEVRLVQYLLAGVSTSSHAQCIDRLALKLLCTNVSSKSSTRHFLPRNSGLSGPKSHFRPSSAGAGSC